MSRKGNKPIILPKGIDISCENGLVKVKGPKGSLEQEVIPEISVKVEDGNIFVSITDDKEKKPFHGLYRTLIENMVEGIEKGFEKKLQMIGVGYRAAVKGNALDIQAGFSHPTEIEIPDGLTISVERNTMIKISGINKQHVGQFAASIRSIRPPEPYQGKGIRYEGEFVRKKAGKSSAKK